MVTARAVFCRIPKISVLTSARDAARQAKIKERENGIQSALQFLRVVLGWRSSIKSAQHTKGSSATIGVSVNDATIVSCCDQMRSGKSLQKQRGIQ